MHTFDEKKLDGYVQAMRIMEKRLAGESAAVQQAGQQPFKHAQSGTARGDTQRKGHGKIAETDRDTVAKAVFEGSGSDRGSG